LKIYIVRHGETEWNKLGKMQGGKNSDLTAKGIDNAKKLGDSLKDIDFGCIYCSPLGRAIQTAENIRGDKDIKIVFKEGLKEMNFGSWEGMKHKEVEELYPEEQFNLWNKPQLYKPIDGENFEQLLGRTRQVIDEIIKENIHENVMVVSHAVLIKAIIAVIKNYSLSEFWNPPFINDTSLSIVEVTENDMKFILEADVSHLN
jgi:probable phosphoglycerate mutase